MAFTEDLSPFFNTDEFARTVTLKGVEVQAVFDNGYSAELGMDGLGPRLTLASADCATVVQGDTAVIGSVNYTVAAVEPDGTGVTLLRLQEA